MCWVAWTIPPTTTTQMRLSSLKTLAYDLTVSVDASQRLHGCDHCRYIQRLEQRFQLMSDGDGDGVYSITVSVGAGAQEYKFLGNGDWGLARASTAQSLARRSGEYVNRVVLLRR